MSEDGTSPGQPADAASRLSPEDYDAIQSAVMETGRGRWFLAEYARRNRQADTTILLDALSRIETAMKDVRPDVADAGFEFGRMRDGMADIAQSIRQARTDVAAGLVEDTGIRHPDGTGRAFDEMLREADHADAGFMSMAARLQDIAFSLRQSGDIGEASEKLDRQALDLYRSATRQSRATERVRSLVGVLRGIEDRLHTLLGEAADEPPRATPASSPARNAATVLDTAPPRMRDDIAFAPPRTPNWRARPAPTVMAEPAPPRPAPDAPPPKSLNKPADSALAAFSAIDALDPEQKLALFV